MALTRFHLAVRLGDVRASRIRLPGRTTGRSNVVLDRLAGRIGHRDWRVDCTLNVHHRIVARDEERVAVLQRQVVERSRVSEDIRQLDADAADAAAGAVENDAVGVRIRSETTRTLN